MMDKAVTDLLDTEAYNWQDEEEENKSEGAEPYPEEALYIIDDDDSLDMDNLDNYWTLVSE